MKRHANAALSLKGRRELCRRVVEGERAAWAASPSLLLRRRCGSQPNTSALAQKEARAAEGPALMLCQGLRARHPLVFALSPWTSSNTTAERGAGPALAMHPCRA